LSALADAMHFAGAQVLLDVSQSRRSREPAILQDEERFIEARMTLYSVRLHLARTKESPGGDPLHGYDFIAPLNTEGHLDAEEWRRSKDRCVVRRFAPREGDQRGRLLHVGKGWHFDYDTKRRDDDEPLFKLDRHLIKQGEYVSLTEHDGVSRPFKIASVTAIP
jgi:hypothetical protein